MRYCELGVGWVGGWVGGEVPVLCGCKGAGLEEGQGHIVYVVEGETVQTVEHGGERAQEVLNVVACLGGWVGGWVGGWFVSSSTQPPIQDIQQCVRTAFFSYAPKQNKPPASQPPTHPPTYHCIVVGRYPTCAHTPLPVECPHSLGGERQPSPRPPPPRPGWKQEGNRTHTVF